jgi:hypothetical protein
MFIDKNNGNVTLPSGFVIHVDLTQSLFRQSPCFKNANVKDYGTLPFIHYSFKTEYFEGKPLRISLCFYGELLINVEMIIDLYPPGPKTWENYSLDTEACIKVFHDDLLKQILGKPHKKRDCKWEKWPAQQMPLRYSLEYKYSWGAVHSGHDNKGGSTGIIVSYGNRNQESNDDYRKRMH